MDVVLSIIGDEPSLIDVSETPLFAQFLVALKLAAASFSKQLSFGQGVVLGM